MIKNVQVAKAVFALCSQKPEFVQEHFETLAQDLLLDSEMAHILVFLSIGALSHSSNGITPLANCLVVDPHITNSFVSMAIKGKEERLLAISALCDRMGTVRSEAANAIFEIIRGNAGQGWYAILEQLLEEDEDNSAERLDIFQTLIDILEG
jgi:hypothetical protein